MPGGHRLKKEPFKFAGRPPPKTRTFQICREATAQKTCTVLIVLQHEEAPREITAQKTRTVLIVLQQDKGGPGQLGDVGAYSSTICTTDTGGGGPGQSGDVGPDSSTI